MDRSNRNVFLIYWSMLIDWFFKQLYHPFAWTYDFVAAAVSLGLWQKWVLAPLPYLTGTNILEVGIGTGHLLKSIHQRGNNVVGVDLSWQMCSQVQRNFYSEGLISPVINGHAHKLPFRSGCFDQIVATFPSKYIKDDSTWSEFTRVLVPGGEMYILLFAWITGSRWYHYLFNWLFRITGQRPEWDEGLIESYCRAGLNCETIVRQVEDSRVMMIHGIKTH